MAGVTAVGYKRGLYKHLRRLDRVWLGTADLFPYNVHASPGADPAPATAITAA